MTNKTVVRHNLLQLNDSRHRYTFTKGVYMTTTNNSVKAQDVVASDNASADDGLQRGMKSRHLQMIAFGSVIGTGLFLGSGASI